MFHKLTTALEVVKRRINYRNYAQGKCLRERDHSNITNTYVISILSSRNQSLNKWPAIYFIQNSKYDILYCSFWYVLYDAENFTNIRLKLPCDYCTFRWNWETAKIFTHSELNRCSIQIRSLIEDISIRDFRWVWMNIHLQNKLTIIGHRLFIGCRRKSFRGYQRC